jgi:hypothetical protein
MPGKIGNKLSIGSSPLADWTLQEALKEAGYEKALQDGKVKVADDGTVTVAKPAGGVAFEGQIATGADLEKLQKTLGEVVGQPTTLADVAGGSGPTVADAMLRTRASRFENRVNDYMWYGVKLTTDLKEEYRLGQRFSLPLVKLPAGEGEIVSIPNPPDWVAKVKDYFTDDDGSVLVPVHPQEMPHRGFDDTDADKTLEVRCASSERTVHAGIPGAPNVMIKLDLANIMHSGVVRPVERDAALGSMATTQFLMDWVDKQGKDNDSFALFPEVMALVDNTSDAAAIIRSPEPYPPPAGGKRTWTMPLYCLTATDQDFPDEPPPLVRMVNDRPDKSVDPLDYFAEKFLEPMIDSALRVHIDLCSSCQAHGQNTALEIGDDGQPSGRVIHQDLEAFWPHPDGAKVTGRDDFFDKMGFVHDPTAKEASVYGTFTAYFHSQNLMPMVRCFAKHFPDKASAVQQRAEQILKDGVLDRRDTVEALKDGPLKGFYDRYVRFA